MLIAAVTMDLAGRKVLLYVSGECLHCNVCLLFLTATVSTTIWAISKPP